jgi:hypothetical protein
MAGTSPAMTVEKWFNSIGDRAEITNHCEVLELRKMH